MDLSAAKAALVQYELSEKTEASVEEFKQAVEMCIRDRDKDMLLLPDSIQNTSPDVIFYTPVSYTHLIRFMHSAMR